jgi:hypothetical protein
MTKAEVAFQIGELLKSSGLGYDDQVKAISMARVALQPRVGLEEWRNSRKPLTKPGEKK